MTVFKTLAMFKVVHLALINNIPINKRIQQNKKKIHLGKQKSKNKKYYFT